LRYAQKEKEMKEIFAKIYNSIVKRDYVPTHAYCGTDRAGVCLRTQGDEAWLRLRTDGVWSIAIEINGEAVGSAYIPHSLENVLLNVSLIRAIAPHHWWDWLRDEDVPEPVPEEFVEVTDED